MSILPIALEVLGRRLLRLGIPAAPMTQDEAARRVPILDRPQQLAAAGPVSLPKSRAQHLLLEAAPATLLLSLYTVTGPTVQLREGTVAQLVRGLARQAPLEIPTYTWSYSFFDRDEDLWMVFYGLEISSEERLRDLVVAIASPDTVEALALAVAAGAERPRA